VTGGTLELGGGGNRRVGCWPIGGEDGTVCGLVVGVWVGMNEEGIFRRADVFWMLSWFLWGIKKITKEYV